MSDYKFVSSVTKVGNSFYLHVPRKTAEEILSWEKVNVSINKANGEAQAQEA